MAETTQSTCEHCGQAAAPPSDQADPAAITPEQFADMTAGQRNELYRANPDLYRRLTGR